MLTMGKYSLKNKEGERDYKLPEGTFYAMFISL
jgi:hypothetical protein